MNKIKMILWGREFNLDIAYDCYSNEKVLKSQEMAVRDFSKLTDAIESSLDKVKEYCLSNNRNEIGANKIENIFKYVVPKYLFVPRYEHKQSIAIMCDYKFDAESGIAIVFENSQFMEIGKQEIIL